MKKMIIGFLASIGFLFIVLLGVLSWKLSSLMMITGKEPEAIGNQNILVVEVGSVPMIDFNLHSSVMSQLQGYRSQSLLEILNTIRYAQKDTRIKGLMLSIEGNSLSLSQVEELRDALIKFQAEGKPIYSFAYSFGHSSNGTTPYYLASVGEKIFMQPAGTLSIQGYALESYFLKGLLDDAQITVQSDRHAEYKGVLEPYLMSSFSLPVKENLEKVLQTIFDHVKQNTIKSRAMKTDDMADIVAHSPHIDTQAVKKGFVNELLYKEQVKEKLKEHLAQGTKDGKQHNDHLSFVSLKTYMSHVPEGKSKKKIGVIIIESDIVSPGYDTRGTQSPFSPEAIDRAFALALKDKDIKAVVLRMNSPGGDPLGAETMWHAVKRTVDAGMPVVVSMGAVAASAGYYIVAPATKIYALPTTMTGSIGVAFAKPNIRKLTEKYGITWDTIEVGKNADMWSMTQDFSPELFARLQEGTTHVYETFMNKVIEGRKLDQNTVHSIAKGQVWSGLQAKEIKLVDDIGGFFDAVDCARKLGKIKDEDPQLLILNHPPFSIPDLFELFDMDVVEEMIIQKLTSKFKNRVSQSHIESRFGLTLR